MTRPSPGPDRTESDVSSRGDPVTVCVALGRPLEALRVELPHSLGERYGARFESATFERVSLADGGFEDWVLCAADDLYAAAADAVADAVSTDEDLAETLQAEYPFGVPLEAALEYVDLVTLWRHGIVPVHMPFRYDGCPYLGEHVVYSGDERS